MTNPGATTAAESPSVQDDLAMNEAGAGDAGESDENEIYLDEDEDEQQTVINAQTNHLSKTDTPGSDEKPVTNGRSDLKKECSKSSSLKDRLRLLKQKMNQARQLNRQAVQEEGQNVQSGNYRSGKAKAATINPLTQQVASQVVNDARQASERDSLNQFAVNDYHNPQGQFRNYQRNLQSLPSSRGQSHGASATTSTYDPAAAGDKNNVAAESAEREGSRRLAQEMHRRIEKKQKRDLKRKQKEMVEDEEGDVGYINQRNKHFNKKINRMYDEATSEIRHNLERGTAL